MLAIHRTLIAQCVVIMTIMVTAACGEPTWMADFEGRLAATDKAKDALALLETLPVADRQSADYHWALARAYRALEKPGPTAEALATYSILPSVTRRDLIPLRAWLSQKAQESFDQARAAQNKGDMKTAMKRFLVAVKCNPALLGEDDHGLRQVASGALDRLVQRDPVKPEYRFHRGYYGYLFGEEPAAVASFQSLSQLEQDPYKKWRAQAWLGHFQREKQAEKPVVVASAPPKPKQSTPPLAKKPGVKEKEVDETSDLRNASVASTGKSSDEKVTAVAEK